MPGNLFMSYTFWKFSDLPWTESFLSYFLKFLSYSVAPVLFNESVFTVVPRHFEFSHPALPGTSSDPISPLACIPPLLMAES